MKGKKTYIPVKQYDLNGNYIRTWPSIKEAQAEYHITHISSVCRGHRRTDGGYVWKYQNQKKKRKKRNNKNKEKGGQELL